MRVQCDAVVYGDGSRPNISSVAESFIFLCGNFTKFFSGPTRAATLCRYGGGRGQFPRTNFSPHASPTPLASVQWELHWFQENSCEYSVGSFQVIVYGNYCSSASYTLNSSSIYKLSMKVVSLCMHAHCNWLHYHSIIVAAFYTRCCPVIGLGASIVHTVSPPVGPDFQSFVERSRKTLSFFLSSLFVNCVS